MRSRSCGTEGKKQVESEEKKKAKWIYVMQRELRELTMIKWLDIGKKDEE